MKIVVLGATGGTGLSLVEQALEKGYDVVTIVRNPAKIAHIKHEKLQVVEGNVFSSESLQPHFEGSDAVFSCLGSNSLMSATTIYSESVKAIVPAMRTAKVKRFVTISTWYVTVDPADDPGRVARWVIRPMLGKPIADMVVMEKYLQEECQDIDYTAVKPPQLTNSASKGKEFVIEERQFASHAAKMIPRADVARFMLRCLETEEYNKKFISIGLK